MIHTYIEGNYLGQFKIFAVLSIEQFGCKRTVCGVEDFDEANCRRRRILFCGIFLADSRAVIMKVLSNCDKKEFRGEHAKFT